LEGTHGKCFTPRKEYIARTLSVEELTDLTLALEKVRAVLAEDYAYRWQRQKE